MHDSLSNHRVYLQSPTPFRRISPDGANIFLALRTDLARIPTSESCAHEKDLASLLVLLASLLASLTAPLVAQEAATAAKPKPEDTEIWEPVPAVVTPGATCGAAPPTPSFSSTARTWTSGCPHQDKSPAKWIVANGVMTVSKAKASATSKPSAPSRTTSSTSSGRFPTNITGTGQARGNSGVFLASTGPGDDGYELQVLDSYNNKTYVNGKAGSIYKQSDSAGQPGPQARRVADLRRGVDRAHLQRRRLAEDSGLCDGVLQRRAGAESLRAEGRDALHRQAVLQEVSTARRSSCRRTATRASRSASAISGSGS